MQEIDDLAAARLVERRGRFVGEDDFGMPDQRARNRDALLLTAGQLTTQG